MQQGLLLKKVLSLAEASHLLGASALLKGLKLDNHDQNVGVDILKRALEEPIRQIINNTGLEPSVIVDKVKILQRCKLRV